jgi:hypothetical protein
MFNPVDVAENLKKYGGYIPGIRPGTKTAEYIDHVLSRLTLAGAVYIAAVCVLPVMMQESVQRFILFRRNVSVDHRLGCARYDSADREPFDHAKLRVAVGE